MHPYDYLATQKHRYIKCGNFVAMVAKTPQKPAFSPPSLHKKTKICSDGKCQRRPDTGHARGGYMCYVYAHNYLTGHGGGGHCLSLPKTSRPDTEIRHRRVSQCAELQIITSDAGLPRHAGIRAKTLSLRGLQNTQIANCL